MRLRVPRFVQQIGSLMVGFLLIMSGLIYGVRAAQPNPMCLSFWKHPGRMQINPFSGKVVPDRNLYESTFDHAARLPSPNDKSVAWIKHPGYGAAETLWIGATGKTQLRQIAIELSIEGGWSPDSHAFAYVYPTYEDTYARIAVINSTGSSKRVQVLPMLIVNSDSSPSFIGWSADGKYMAVANGPTVVFLLGDTLQPLSTTIIAAFQSYSGSMLAWSPQGHRFAYVDQTTTPFHVVIATPEHEEQRFSLKAANTGYVYPRLMWSPDGRYVMMAQQMEDAEHSYDGVKWAYWSYNIFGMDGSARIDIKGQKITNDPEGWWAEEGATWIFRQQLPKQGVNETDADILSYYTAYHVDTNTEQILAEHVAGSPLLSADKQWFAMPIWDNGTIAVELYSMDGKTQARLVTGARLDTPPTLTWSEANGGIFAVVWTRMGEAGEPIAALTWVHADGSGQHTVDKNFSTYFDSITDLYWLQDGRSLYFVAQQKAYYTAQIVDLDTAALISLYYGPQEGITAPSEDWMNIQRVFDSPSGRQFVFLEGTLGSYSLYVASLDTQEMRLIRKDIYDVSWIYWSADGETFAFRQSDGNLPIDGLTIMSANGSKQYYIDVGPQYSVDLAGWTWCQ